MKKIYTITFHSSYNYGSNLQAYALQEYIKKICNCDYKIINLRNEKQIEMYKNPYERKGLKNNIKKIILLKYKKDLFGKEEKFEYFIKNRLNITKQISSINEIKDIEFDNRDYFVSGSDQIWNIQAIDFDWANFLEFTESVNKVSYAASFGPTKYKMEESSLNRIKKDIKEYKNLSVREEESKNFIEKLTEKKIDINVDPTMLLKKKEWEELIGENNLLLNFDYILLYDLGQKKETYKIAKIISEKLKMPIVISKFNGVKDIFLPFKKYINCGPQEFLNLVYNAKLVLSTSFHGNVFATIFNRPFFAINGDRDNRIKELLKITKLEDRSINLDNLNERITKTYDINFNEVEKYIDIEREKSKQYLKKALDIKE